MRTAEQKVRGQAAERGAEVEVHYGRSQPFQPFTVAVYSEPGTHFVTNGIHTIREYRGPGDTIEELWARVYERMAEGIDDCPESCECRDEAEGA
jgi:hypothetical protein